MIDNPKQPEATTTHHTSQPVPQPAPVPVPEPVGGNDVEKMVHAEPWYKKMWRPMLAITYIIIVIFDFMIMPIVIENFNERGSDAQAVELALKFSEPSAQIQALKTFAEKRSWSPLTLMGAGMFHVAFGALLTGAAVTRGMEKKQHASNGKFLN